MREEIVRGGFEGGREIKEEERGREWMKWVGG